MEGGLRELLTAPSKELWLPHFCLSDFLAAVFLFLFGEVRLLLGHPTLCHTPRPPDSRSPASRTLFGPYRDAICPLTSTPLGNRDTGCDLTTFGTSPLHDSVPASRELGRRKTIKIRLRERYPTSPRIARPRTFPQEPISHPEEAEPPPSSLPAKQRRTRTVGYPSSRPNESEIYPPYYSFFTTDQVIRQSAQSRFSHSPTPCCLSSLTLST